MLAGVDYILMGAGIPHQMPGILDRLANHEPVAVKVTREDDNESVDLHFDPKGIFEVEFPRLKRPHFLGIVTSPLIAQTILKRAKGPVAGFIVEGYTAGGHNAPPRGQLKLNEIGEPIYGERDIPDMQKFQALGMPYWLAGGMGRPNQLAEAIRSGAYGIQVGTAFAFCKDSGLDDSLRLRVLEKVKNGTAKVFTDPLASPTGFPFKVVELAGTMSEDEVYKSRARVCDIGLLRHPYRKPDGSTGFRCPADDIGLYTKKGGAIEDTERRKCICNGLLATVGLGQVRSAGVSEIPIITAGDDLTLLGAFLKEDTLHYSADDVIDALQGGVEISPEGVATLIEPAPVGN
jgi:NAD(P)H-dependent flavin oxidoreductase YrpB (nitropropane dioxygenase family)